MQGIGVRVAAATALVLSVSSAQALEPFRVYDQFSDPVINPDRFQFAERVLQVHNGGLIVMQRAWPLNGADVGVGFSSWAESLQNPNAITAMRARVNVRAIEASTCATNPGVANSRARIIGSFFNANVPTPGSQLDDVTAQVRLNRASNSADAPDVLRVQGLVFHCTNVDCSSTLTIGNPVDLGTVKVGTATVIEFQWDKAGKTFYFSRDRGAFSGTVAYTESDAMPPGVAVKQLSTRVDLPNCMSAPRTPAMVDARFDNVQVNQSAAPQP
jgi:hypothetical protein